MARPSNSQKPGRAKHATNNAAESLENYALRIISGLTPANRAPVRTFFDAKRAQGLRASSLRNLLACLRRFDHLIRPTPMLPGHPAALTAALTSLRAQMSPGTVEVWLALVRSFYKFHNDDALPRPIRQALPTRGRHKPLPPVLLSEENFRRMLQHTASRADTRLGPLNAAILWTLWDSGCRQGELRMLRISDFRPEPDGGAYLDVPDEDGCKTGARTIYVRDCVPHLQAWLAGHPTPLDPDAHIFPSARDPRQPRGKTAIYFALQAVKKRAKVTAPARPHIFRHTRVTRAARAGWNDAQLRTYFGWSAGSTELSRNIHLAAADMAARVKADTPPPTPPASAAPPPAPATDAAQLAAVVAAAVAAAMQAIPKAP